MFFSSLLIINYNRIFQELIFKNILEINENILISIYVEKNNQYKIIKEIARIIGGDITEYSIMNAKELRNESKAF